MRVSNNDRGIEDKSLIYAGKYFVQMSTRENLQQRMEFLTLLSNIEQKLSIQTQETIKILIQYIQDIANHISQQERSNILKKITSTLNISSSPVFSFVVRFLFQWRLNVILLHISNSLVWIITTDVM
jgi:ferritin